MPQRGWWAQSPATTVAEPRPLGYHPCWANGPTILEISFGRALFFMDANRLNTRNSTPTRGRLSILSLLALTLILLAHGAAQATTTVAFDLGALNGPNGFRLTGINPGDEAGRSLHNAGDLNGDGLDDVVIGAGAATANGMQGAGQAYVVFGATSNPTALNLADLGGTGFRLSGTLFNDAAGAAVGGGGDVNGDGFADLIIGAPGAGAGGLAGAGAVYVVFGAATFPAQIDLDALDGSDGFRLDGAAEEQGAGAAVGHAGDLNGDGYDDLIIGAPNATVDGLAATGQTYVVFGRATFAPQLDLAALGDDGLTIAGIAAESYAGHAVDAAGDVNGDGYGDAVITAPGAGRAGAAEAGAVYLLLGRPDLPAQLDLSDLSGAVGRRIEGAAAGDHAGQSAAGGDVNGDGRGDLIIGAPDAANHAGRAYVVLGGDALPNVTLLSALTGTNGFTLPGGAANSATGSAVGAADVNGDGRADVLVGAPVAGTGSDRFAGRVYAVFGRASFGATVDLSALDTTAGLVFDGAAAGDQAGQAVASAGDRDGDGFDEMLIGAPNSGVGPQRNRGAAFLVRGGPTLGVPMPLTHPGTPGDDIVSGASGNDVLHGHRGDDQLDAAAGDDALKGGQGDDVLNGGAGGDILAGGNGVDSASYADSPAGVAVNLFTGAAGGGHAAGDRLASVEGLVGSPLGDTLTGDAADNRLDGGPGDDALAGGGGHDAFAFTPASGADTIAGFAAGAGSDDYLDFTGLPTVAGLGDLAIQPNGGDTLITLPGGATIRLLGVAPGALHADDYRFAGAPLARPDAFSTPVNTPLSVAAPGVLGNDDSPSAAPLSAVLVAGPDHGALTLRANGSFTYTPAANFLGSDAFTYRATNGQNSNVATVTLTVTPLPPTAVADSYTVELGATLTIAAPGVLGNDTNPGGGPLTAVLVEPPVHGALSLAAHGGFTYTPATDMATQDSFRYRADNGLASNVATVVIAIVDPDGPPVAVDDSYSASAGQPLTVAAPGVLGNDVNPLAGGMTAVLAAGPAHGALTLNANGSFTYTPQSGYQGADSFTYRASNGQLSNVATVRITVTGSEGYHVFLPVGVAP